MLIFYVSLVSHCRDPVMVGMARNAWRSTLRRTGASRGHRLESTLRVYCDDAKATVRPRALGVHQMCPQREYSCIQSLRPSKCGESMLLQVHCVRCCSLAGAPVVRNQRSVKYGVRSTVPNRTVASEDPASKQEAWRPSERSSLVPALERVFCDLSKQFSPSQAVAPPPLPLHFVVAVRYLSPNTLPHSHLARTPNGLRQRQRKGKGSNEHPRCAQGCSPSTPGPSSRPPERDCPPARCSEVHGASVRTPGKYNQSFRAGALCARQLWLTSSTGPICRQRRPSG